MDLKEKFLDLAGKKISVEVMSARVRSTERTKTASIELYLNYSKNFQENLIHAKRLQAIIGTARSAKPAQGYFASWAVEDTGYRNLAITRIYCDSSKYQILVRG